MLACKGAGVDVNMYTDEKKAHECGPALHVDGVVSLMNASWRAGG